MDTHGRNSMSKDKVQQIMQDLTEDKNKELSIQLAELAKKKKADRKEFNGISEQELIGLASYFIEPNGDNISKITREDEESI
jgi:hypothetical protein